MTHLIIGFCISGIFALHVVFSVSEIKRDKKIRGILFFSIMMFAGIGINFLTKNGQNSGEINIYQIAKVIQMVIVFLIGSFFIHGGITRTVFSIAISDVVVVASELLERVIYFVIIHQSMDGFYIAELSENSFLQYILLIICNILVCILLNRFFRKIRSIPFENRILAKVLACFYVAAGFSPTVKAMYTVEKERELLLLSAAVGCVFLGFIALFLSERNRIFQQRNLHLFLQEQMMKEHVRLMEDQIAITRKFRHDIRKHLDMVSYFVKQNPKYETSQQLEEYKSDLCEMYQSLSRGDYCDLQDVNAILYQLEKFCKKNGIVFQAKLKDIDCKFMQTEERCDIFFSVVNWGMITCKPYIEAKREISVELSGETAAGRSVLALSVREEGNTGINKGDKQGNQASIQENVWLEQMEKSLAKYDGFWKVENRFGMNELFVSWLEKYSLEI